MPGPSRPTQVLLAALLGAAGPVLASCGSGGAGLIPSQNAGPLRADFDAVAEAAETGNGSCIATEEAILKTERDFTALPGSVDAGLRKRLSEGISALRSDALGICKQPRSSTTATSTTPKTSTTTRSTSTTPTVTQTTTTSTQTTPTTTPTTTGTGGGTPAPSEGTSGSEQGAAGVGGAPAGAGSGAGGQEGGK